MKSFENRKKQECGGLCSELLLKIGIKYMIVINIDLEDGLVNGACGILKHITFSNKDVPLIIWLDFNNNKIGNKSQIKYNSYIKEYNIDYKLIPISKMDVIINTKNNYQFIRSQLSVCPAEAMIIHKSQGQTYDKVIIDLNKFGKFRSRSLYYVAFSSQKNI